MHGQTTLIDLLAESVYINVTV